MIVSVTPKAIWYIESHLSEELTLEKIADAAGVSRFHLSRAFAASTGGSIAAYIRARRLSEAAKALSKGAPDILAVALDAGYGSHEAFTRAFRQYFGVTPEKVREQVQSVEFKEPIRMNEATKTPLAPPRLVKGEAMLMFGLSERCPTAGSPTIPALWNRFGPHIGHIDGQIGSVAYGVVYNTDDSTAYDYLCAVEVREFPSRPADFTRLRIPPQTYAVFEHREHISSILSTFKAIWERGLAESGYRAADGPTIERYDEKFNPQTGFGGLEIWVPVKAN